MCLMIIIDSSPQGPLCLTRMEERQMIVWASSWSSLVLRAILQDILHSRPLLKCTASHLSTLTQTLSSIWVWGTQRPSNTMEIDSSMTNLQQILLFVFQAQLTTQTSCGDFSTCMNKPRESTRLWLLTLVKTSPAVWTKMMIRKSKWTSLIWVIKTYNAAPQRCSTWTRPSWSLSMRAQTKTT